MKPRVVVLSPLIAHRSLLAVSTLLFFIGLCFWSIARNTAFCVLTYDASSTGKRILTIDRETCPFIGNVLNGKYSIFYEFGNFYQNSKKYKQSIDYRQLQGHVVEDEKSLHICEPYLKNHKGQIYHPCGAVALQVFTDVYTLYDDENLLYPIAWDESAKTITANYGVHTLFKNVPLDVQAKYGDKFHFWMEDDYMRRRLSYDKSGHGVENGHFINWIDVSPLPQFKKLYAVLDAKRLHLPLYLEADVSYVVMPTEATRNVVILQQSLLGDSAHVMALFYIITAAVCLMIYFFSWHFIK